MSKEVKTTFSRLIQQILDENNINLTELATELYDLGLDIKYSALYSYYSGSSVPPFRTANKILTSERIFINDNELDEILAYSSKISKTENIYKDRILRLDVKIKPEVISKEFENNPDGLRNIIDLRSNELFGDDDLITKYSVSGKRKLGAYISYLIKKDLIENELIKNELIKEED